MGNNNKKGGTLIVLGLMAFLANGDNYAGATLIKNIASDLGISISMAAISITAYMLSFGLFTLLFGPLSDRFGKVRVINAAAFGTAIFSMLGAASFDLPSLTLFRAMNGLFGSGIFPVTLALAGEMYNDEHRQAAIGKVMGLGFLGAATATAIGGTLSYFGSWRMVYLAYGVAELVLAIIMAKILTRDQPVVKKLKLVSAYKEAFSSWNFMKVVLLLFFVGYAILGSFTYMGLFIMKSTGVNIFVVGFILALYGVGTVVGGRIVPKVKKRLGGRFLVFAGALGFLGLSAILVSDNIVVISLGLFGFGLAFIFLQSTMVATAQARLPKRKGTAMSLASFNMFLGAAIGTTINGKIIEAYSYETVFRISSIILLLAGIFATIVTLDSKPKKSTQGE